LQKSQKKVSVTANADEILNYANQWGVEMVLHGHEHQPTVTAVRRWPVDGANVFSPLVSVGAGSFEAIRDFLGPFSRNHYYIIYRQPDRIIIRSRFQGDGGVKFVTHSDMQISRTIPRFNSNVTSREVAAPHFAESQLPRTSRISSGILSL